MADDTEVLLKGLDCSFAKSICLSMVRCWVAQVDIELAVQLLGELGGKLRTTVGGDMSRKSVEAPYLVDVCICNICCCAGCFCWKVALYVREPSCNDQNCVEAL